jgi:hypothetical protein
VIIVYNYGKCEICNTPLEEKNIQQDFTISVPLIKYGIEPVAV